MEIFIDILFTIVFLFVVVIGYLAFIAEEKHKQLIRKKELQEINLRIDLVKQEITNNAKKAYKTLDIITKLGSD